MGTKEGREEVKRRCAAAEAKHGELWYAVDGVGEDAREDLLSGVAVAAASVVGACLSLGVSLASSSAAAEPRETFSVTSAEACPSSASSARAKAAARAVPFKMGTSWEPSLASSTATAATVSVAETVGRAAVASSS